MIKYKFFIGDSPSNRLYTPQLRNVLSFETQSKSRSTLDEPIYGIISNGARLTIEDKDKTLLGLLNTNQLYGKKCYTTLFNTLKGTQSDISAFFVDKVDYDTVNYICNLTFTDGLQEWQNIQIEGYKYDPYESDTPAEILSEKSWAGVYKYLYSKTPAKYLMSEFNFLPNAVKSILYAKDYSLVSFLNSGSLWKQWTKLCEAGGFCIYKKPDGIITMDLA
jgi:hypothetical protein